MKAQHRCFGTLVDYGGSTADQLDTVMTGLNFASPIATGPFCKLYEREDITMVAEATVKPENLGLLVFRLGGPSIPALRRVLGKSSPRPRFRST
ncbi:hypothetical protein [Nannocystis pusilla]|uniref:hypothetical protein n=1 Tax=Nannocystis pusilla TaxID=889268 RepID=UPI003B7E9FA2